MAHRLHAAGITSELSEHFQNYMVVPKRAPHRKARDDHGPVCCLRPHFRCEPLAEHVCPVTGCKTGCSCPYCTKCCGAAPHPGPKKQHLAAAWPVQNKCSCPEGCCCSVCCAAKKKQTVSCPKKRTFTFSITLPGDDGPEMEHKILEKMKKIKKDLRKFDETMACLGKKGHRTEEPVVTCTMPCRREVTCRREVPCHICYVPVCQKSGC